MNLNDRLQAIANRIEKGETMADIGTDHGFLPIYLVEAGISPRAVMTDVSRPSLMKGRQNFEEHLSGSDGKVEFRVGDGLSTLEPAEVDTVVIAGMGGKLIRDIMGDDMDLTRSFGKFVLQPRIRQGELRKWLLQNGFAIIHEDLAKEGKHISEIITAVPRSGKEEGPGRNDREGSRLCITEETVGSLYGDDKAAVFYDVPPWITQSTGPVEDFIERNLESEKRKLENVMLSRERKHALESDICDSIYYLKGLLEG